MFIPPLEVDVNAGRKSEIRKDQTETKGENRRNLQEKMPFALRFSTDNSEISRKDFPLPNACRMVVPSPANF